VHVSVQYRVIVRRAYDAYYRLSDPTVQIRAFVFDVVRATVPHLSVDQVFTSKKGISSAVHDRLSVVMGDFGYEILGSLVTNITPDPTVIASMNEIAASRRLKEAMPHRAEAMKTRVVKQAEADGEAMYLQGCGTAQERIVLAQALKTTVLEWTDDKKVTSKDVIDLLLITQYLDMLHAVGANELVLRHGPGEVFAIQRDLPTTPYSRFTCL
jgi:regulator of protease activity HflC (stomatin/prohibitin superfamily)